MKKSTLSHLLLTSLFFISAIIAWGQAPTKGLVVYYPLNKDANDYSGNNYNGALNGQIRDTGCSMCKPDSGMHFVENGVDCGSPVNHDFDLQGNATISLWVQFRNVASLSKALLISKDDGGGNFNKWMLLYNYNGPANSLAFPINGAAGPIWAYSAPFIFNINVCYHVAVTKQFNTGTGNYDYTFYVNSASLGTGSLNRNIPIITTDMFIGQKFAGFEGCNVDALIDRVRLYNRCLGQSGIDSLYHETIPQISMTPATADTTTCAGSKIDLSISGGNNYTWNNGATSSAITESPITDTTYVVSNTMPGVNCVSKDSIKVTVSPQIVPGISSIQTICSGKSVQLSASGGTSYSWTPATGLSSQGIADPVVTLTTTATDTTKYIVTITNGPCKAKDSVSVAVHPLPTANACCNTSITEGQNAYPVLTPVTSGDTYTWFPVTGLSCTTCADPTATPSTTVTYTIDVTNAQGCVKTDTVVITVKESCGPVYMPTAFSPNGDGVNDILNVMGNCIQSMDLKIYDRWGNLIYEGRNTASGWDGTYRGKPLNTGTFAYYLVASTSDGQAIQQKGNVALIR